MNEFNRLRRNILLNSGGLPAGYEWATDADFSGTTNGAFKYIGTKQYVAIPHTIKGINVTSYYGMFSPSSSSVKGVYSDNLNVTDMIQMFYQSKATTLDLSSLNTSKVTEMNSMFNNSQATILGLSNFDTSNVTNMSAMFDSSPATTLDLSSFDTSKVTRMDYMFYSSKATTLDLSSFDTSRVSSMGQMFRYSQATTGYARTQADANKFNASSRKPANLKFIVKPQ